MSNPKFLDNHINIKVINIDILLLSIKKSIILILNQLIS